MDVKTRGNLISGLSVAAGLLFLLLVGVRVINFIERRAKNRQDGPGELKAFPPLEGRWENDRGYVVFRKEGRSFGNRYVSHSMERLADGVKETALVTGPDSGAWLNELVGGDLVLVKKARWEYDHETLTFWDEAGRKSVYRRREEGPGGEKVEAAPIDPAWDEAGMTPAYLSDLPEIDPSVGYGKFGKNGRLGYGIAGARDSPITVGGRKYPKAISLAPPHGGSSTVKYSLGGGGKIFRSQVAVNDLDDAKRKGPATPLQFQLLGDGRYIWASQPVRQAGAVQECRVNVAGVKLLELQVHCPGPMDCARAVWLEPRVLK
jgi:hypothetical protein